MPEERDHLTTIVGLTGKKREQIHLLANMAPTVSDPDDICSVVATLRDSDAGFHLDTDILLEAWLTSLDETPSGHLYAVSMEGDLHYVKNKTWTTLDLQCPDGLDALWAASDRVLFAVGDDGACVRIVDMLPTRSVDKKKRTLNHVHGTSPDDAYAVGDNGCILHFQHNTWTEMESPTNATLMAVLCHDDAVYIAGSEGTLFRFKDDEWDEFHSGKEDVITSLAWCGGALYAAAGVSGIYRLESQGLKKIKDRIADELRTINGVLYAFSGDFIMQFDGKKNWSGYSIGI